jgi:predicted ATP-grasp superfamily ATP-dependent carboligase
MKLDAFLRRCDKTAPAMVLGGLRGALGMARDLGRNGVPVLALSPYAPRGLEYSRYALAAPCADVERAESQFLDDLEDYGALLPQRAVVFPIEESIVTAVSRHRTRLEKHFIIPGLPWDRMQRLADKEQQVRLARQAKVPTPWTAFIHGPADVEKASTEMPSTCMLKPSLPHGPFQQQDLKGVLIEDPRQLLEEYGRFRDAGPMLLQEFIPGGDGHVYMAGTSHDAASRCIAIFTGRKLRQHPHGLGIARLAESRWSQEVADLTLRVLDEVGYRGISDVEFKLDPRDGSYKFIEINARYGLCTPLATAAGVNLPYITYRDAIGKPCASSRQRDGVRWIDLRNDAPDSWREWRRGELSLRDWVLPLAGVRADMWVSWRDPAPVVCDLRDRARLAIRRRRRWAG